ncbi:CRTAC1 family protein, partial [Alphaproteobacteria bacterium]|nr:CRTAC1 family protein [Alphaproteobacteria bacterium]
NLALSFKKKKIKNIIKNKMFADQNRKAIGIAACDVDIDGKEEIYILNTDSFSGKKIYADRLLDFDDNIMFKDLFEDTINEKSLNFTAGRSVACVDRMGNGKNSIYVSNYGGPARFYSVQGKRIVDEAPKLNINKITGGRAIVAGHILSDRVDIFASNERGPNFLYKNLNNKFVNVAKRYGVEDVHQNGRGTVLADILYRGKLDILSANWQGYHRIYVLRKNKFLDLLDLSFNRPSKARTIISADFDNDGYDEIFINNIGQPNKLFKVRENGVLESIPLQSAKLFDGFGTGAAVADVDGDGILELLISNGESFKQPLNLFKAKIEKNSSFLRIRPLNKYNSPARGATVILKSNLRKHAKTIDAGSGYLCQMEPVAHFGIRKGEEDFKITIKWTNGESQSLSIDKLNQELKIKQKI